MYRLMDEWRVEGVWTGRGMDGWKEEKQADREINRGWKDQSTCVSL